jgi:hypothetical protein
MSGVRTKSEPKELLDMAAEVLRFLHTKSEAGEEVLDTATKLMRLLRPKGEPRDLLDTVSDSLAAMGGRAHRKTLLKTGLIAGGVAALTAGSAAISSLRRRAEASS